MKHYSIYLVIRDTERGRSRGRWLFGGDRAHLALMLAEETSEGSRGLFQIDGFSYQEDKNFNWINSGWKKINMLSTAFEHIGLSGIFRKAVGLFGKDNELARLKVRETIAKRDPNQTRHLAIAGGKPEDMMQIWLAACEAALEINKADMIFMSAGLRDLIQFRKPSLAFGQTARNCQSVASSLARIMGFSLSPNMVRGFTTPGFERLLAEEVPQLKNIRPKYEDLDMDELLERRAALSARIKETCCIIADEAGTMPFPEHSPV